MEGIQIGAIPIREGHFFSQKFMELLRAVQIAAVDMYFFHLRFTNT